MTKIDFINALKTVLLAARETNSVLFDKGWVRGVNEELSLSYKFETGIEAALPIKELLRVLILMKNGYPIEVAQDDTFATSKCGPTVSFIRFECGPTVLRLVKLTDKENFKPLDLNNAKWSPAPERLLDGLKLSLLSTHRSVRGQFAGIVIKGNKIISSDNFRLSVYEMDGEVGPDALRIDVGSIKSLLRLKTKFDLITLADGWLYFKSENLVAGIRLMPVKGKKRKDYPLEKVLSFFDQVDIADKTYELPNNLEELIGNVETMAESGRAK